MLCAHTGRLLRNACTRHRFERVWREHVHVFLFVSCRALCWAGMAGSSSLGDYCVLGGKVLPSRAVNGNLQHRSRFARMFSSSSWSWQQCSVHSQEHLLLAGTLARTDDHARVSVRTRVRARLHARTPSRTLSRTLLRTHNARGDHRMPRTRFAWPMIAVGRGGPCVLDEPRPRRGHVRRDEIDQPSRWSGAAPSKRDVKRAASPRF